MLTNIDQAKVILGSSDSFYGDRILVKVQYVEPEAVKSIPLLLRTNRTKEMQLQFFQLNRDNRLLDVDLSINMVNKIKEEFKSSFLYGRKSFTINLISGV